MECLLRDRSFKTLSCDPRNTTLSNPQSFNILYLLGGRGGFAGGRKVIVEPHRHEGKTS
jgi:hypothetical protein